MEQHEASRRALLSSSGPRDLNSNMDLPFTLEEWASRCLGADTAPLLAALAMSAAKNTDGKESERWQTLCTLCEISGLPLQRPPEPDAIAEREASRQADAVLGGGPVSIALHPALLEASPSASTLPVSAQPHGEFHGTFGSSRDDAPLPGMCAALLPTAASQKAGTLNALRFRQPGPGAYTPEQDGRTYRAPAAGVTWGREDRYKHLARTIRPRNQYTALPLRCGPAPGFYSNPKVVACRSHAHRRRLHSPLTRCPHFPTVGRLLRMVVHPAHVSLAAASGMLLTATRAACSGAVRSCEGASRPWQPVPGEILQAGGGGGLEREDLWGGGRAQPAGRRGRARPQPHGRGRPGPARL